MPFKSTSSEVLAQTNQHVRDQGLARPSITGPRSARA